MHTAVQYTMALLPTTVVLASVLRGHVGRAWASGSLHPHKFDYQNRKHLHLIITS